MDSYNRNYRDMPYILVKESMIIDVNNLFLELSCFISEDLLFKPLDFIWNDLLRINTAPCIINGCQETYMFTRNLEARYVYITSVIQSELNSITYIFSEKPEYRLDKKFLFVEHLYTKGTTGLAIYSAPDLILLKGNDMSFSFLDKPYNKSCNSIGKNAASIISGFRGSEAEEKWNNAIATGEVYEIKEMPHEGFNRGTTYWNMKGVPIFEEGAVKYLIQIIEDVTQTVLHRKKMEKQAEIIKRQKEELEVIVQNMSDALFVVDKNDNIKLLNEEAKGRFNDPDINKYSKNTENTRYYYLDGREIFSCEMPATRALKGEKIKNFKMVVRQPKREYAVQLTAEPVNDLEGNIEKVIVCSHDITDIIQKERILRQQKEQLEVVIENMSDGLCVVDKKGNFIKMNRAFNEFMGNNYNSNAIPDNVEAAVGNDLLFFDEYGKSLTHEELPMLRVLKGEVMEKEKIVFKSKAGESIIDISATPIFGDNGEFLYGIIMGHDITHVIEKERLINKEKEDLEAIIENFGDAIFIYDKDSNHYMQNKAARDYFEDSRLQQFGDGFTNAKYYDFNDKEIPREKMTISKVLKGQIVKDDRIKMVQGDNVRYINVSGRPVYNQDKSVRLSILHSRDITEDVKKENIIREQQELLLKGEREKQEALKASMELKDEFLYLITHEFRTPIAVISSALQTIEMIYKEEITEKVGSYLKMIKQNTNRQLRLVNNLLDITRINSGNVKMNMSSFDIVHVVGTIVDSVQLYGQEKHLAISFNSTLKSRYIFSDEEKIERIMLNLLANALKFTPSEGRISVSLSEIKHGDRNMISISVEDKGIGIPEDKQKAIFERFGQVDSSLSRRAEGTGLGLYLVKLLVKALDGEIMLVSEVGRGSTFTVLLPICEPTVSNEEPVKNEMGLNLINSSDRVIESVVIEFSDIYL